MPKKQPCENCSKPCQGRHGLCLNCFRLKQCNDYANSKTKSDFTATNSRHRHEHVRKHARRLFDLLNIEKKCKVCGYTYYVELCHIKSISDFEDNSFLSDINHLNNLVYLCPNHHKELDNGDLNI